jgi:hypothetical protein
MARKARITLGIALIVAALAVIGRAVPWISIPLILLAVFFIVWGKEQRGTESFIKRLPFGIEIRKFLDAFDSVLTPRDRDYEQHVKTIVTGYDPEAQAALRKLYRTRNTNQIADHYRGRFVADGFIEYPKDGPGWIKPELRDVVARTLDDLAA